MKSIKLQWNIKEVTLYFTQNCSKKCTELESAFKEQGTFSANVNLILSRTWPFVPPLSYLTEHLYGKHETESSRFFSKCRTGFPFQRAKEFGILLEFRKSSFVCDAIFQLSCELHPGYPAQAPKSWWIAAKHELLPQSSIAEQVFGLAYPGAKFLDKHRK